LEWIPGAHHCITGGQGVVPDALLHYRTSPNGRGPVLQALVDVDHATAEPARLCARPAAYARLHGRAGVLPSIPRQPAQPELAREERRPHRPPLPRLLFVLDGTGAAGVENRIIALESALLHLGPAALPGVPVLAATLADILRDGPSAPIWRPVRNPDQRVPWTCLTTHTPRPGPVTGCAPRRAGPGNTSLTTPASTGHERSPAG
jgi:hypothetical protein